MRYHFDGADAIVNENDQIVYEGITDERTADFLLRYMNGYENTKERLIKEIDINKDLLAVLEALVAHTAAMYASGGESIPVIAEARRVIAKAKGQ